MATPFHVLCGDLETLVQLEPPELGALILQVWETLGDNSGHTNTFPPTYVDFILGRNFLDGYPNFQQAAAVLAEGWNWLVREGLIAPAPHARPQYVCYKPTRLARRLSTHDAVLAYAKAAELPTEMLHPTIRPIAESNFTRRKYDVAVFEAFREVEVAVRTAGGFTAADIGVPLVRKAFDKTAGPLTDPAAEEGERDAMAHLFAGAMGLYKNPHSHRKVDLGAQEAFEMLVFASHLLSIVEARVAAKPKSSPGSP